MVPLWVEEIWIHKKTLWETSKRKENTAKRGTFEDQRERPKKTLHLPTNLILAAGFQNCERVILLFRTPICVISLWHYEQRKASMKEKSASIISRVWQNYCTIKVKSQFSKEKIYKHYQCRKKRTNNIFALY